MRAVNRAVKRVVRLDTSFQSLALWILGLLFIWAAWSPVSAQSQGANPGAKPGVIPMIGGNAILDVSPVNGSTTATGNSTSQSYVFYVENTGTANTTANFSISSCTGAVSSCSYSPLSATVTHGGSVPVTVTFHTAATGSGTIMLTANWGGANYVDGSVTVTLPGAQPSVTASPTTEWTQQNVSTGFPYFTIRNTGNTAAYYNLTANCTNVVVGSCSVASPTGTVAPNGTTTAEVRFTTNPASSGNETVTLTATSPYSETSSQTVTIVPMSEYVTVGGQGAPTPPLPSGSATYSFTITATGNNTSTVTYGLTANCTGALSCSTTPSPGSVGISPGSPSTASVAATATSNTAGGTGTVTLTALYTDDWGIPYTGQYSYSVTVPPAPDYTPGVVPSSGDVGSLVIGQQVIDTFVVRNQGNQGATYRVSAHCDGAITTTCFLANSIQGRDGVQLEPNETALVPVRWQASGSATTSHVSLTAVDTVNGTVWTNTGTRTLTTSTWQPSIAANGPPSGGFAPDAIGLVQSFKVTNTGNSSATYSYSVSCVDGVGEAAVPASCVVVTPAPYTIAAGASATVQVRFNSGDEGTSSTMTLSATSSPYSTSGAATISINQLPPTITTATPSVADYSGISVTRSFVVHNPNAVAETYSWTTSCSGVASCTPDSRSIGVPARDSVSIAVTYTPSGAPNATGAIVATASNVSGSATDSIVVRIRSYMPQVTVVGSPDTLASGGGGTAHFTVKNIGLDSMAYVFTASCDNTAATTCVQPSSTPVPILPSQQVTVLVPFIGGTNYASGSVVLHALPNGSTPHSDSAAFVVNIHSPNGVQVSTSFMNNDDQDMSLCVASCFAMTASRSTVPYYTLDTPRSVTLAYNGDRAFPRPFVYADVSVPSAPANIQSYTLEVKRLGARLTFINGDSILTFGGTSTPGTTYRLAGQIDMSSYGTAIDSVTLVVTAHYANGMSDVTPVKTQLMIVNSTLNTQSSPVAKGWTIAGLQHFSPTPEGSGSPNGGYMIENGDGSATYFASNGATGADFSTLHFDNVATWIRTYPDSSKVLFDGGGRMLAAIDRLGRKTTFNYGGLDSLQVVSIIEPMRTSGNSTSAPYLMLSYDGSHHLQSISEMGGTNGRTTSVSVDPNSGRLTRITDPDGGYDSYGYDGSGRLNTVTDRRGSTTTYYYDATWKLSQIVSPSVPTDAGGGTTVMGTPTTNISPWQAVGVPTASTVSNPAPLLEADTIAARITDPKGYVSTLYVDRWGEAVKTVDPLGNITTITRQGFLPTVVKHPDGSVDSASYNPSNGLLLTQRAAGQQTTSYTYGNMNQVATVSGNGVVSVTNTLDSLGRVKQTHYGTVAGDTTIFTYDPITKNVASMFRADTGLVGYQYDSNFGNLSSKTYPGARVTQSYFDSYGRDTSTKMPQHLRTRVVYDSLNRVTASYDSVGANPVRIKYDAILPVSVRDQLSHVDSTEYDALGRATRHFGYASSTLATTARYDLDSRPTSTTNRRGQRIDVTYDPLGRVLSKAGGNNETTTDSFTYSANGLIQTAANATDSVRTATVPSALLDTVQTTMWAPGVTRHTYTVVHYHSADVGGTDSTTISSDGAPAQFVTRRYVKDATNGTLKSIDLGLNIGHGNFIYDAPGRRISTALPTGVGGNSMYLRTGTHASQNFNPGLSGYLSVAYRVDSAGRIRADSRTLTGSDTVDTNRVFAYDALGRYAGVTDASGYSWACSQNRNRYDVNYGAMNCPIDSLVAPQLYSYDAAGNRADPGDTLGVGDQMIAITYSGMHQGYTYDADGNVISRALPVYNVTWYYHWSSDNRLLSGGSDWGGMENLDYDALGQPVVMRKGGDYHIARVTLYDGGNILADLDSLGNRVGEYVYDAGTDHPYALLTGATAVTGAQYFVLDDMGNVTGTVYDSTHVAQTDSYDDWGDLQTVTGDQTNRLAWKGLPVESRLWLSQVRARWYDPVLGRFISEDPLGLAAGINPYLFADDDPTNGRDPSGLCPPTEIQAETLDNGDVVPFCPDGSDPVFSSTTPSPPVNVTAAAPPWPFSTSRTSGYDDASDRGGDLTALFRSPGVTPFTGPNTPASVSGHPAGTPHQTEPAPTNYFGTRYCGPGGSGTPVNALDSACQRHDACYEQNHLGIVSNFNPFPGGHELVALSRCNSALCSDALGGASNVHGSTRVFLYFHFIPARASCY